MSEFFVQGTDRFASHVLLHIVEPQPNPENPKGYFFAVIEINNGTIEQIQQVQQLIDEVDTLYQQATSNEEQTAFEQALAKLNQKTLSLFSTEIIEIHSFIGVIEGQSLEFSFFGSPCAMLLYEDEQGQSKMMELVQESKVTKPGKLFSTVTQGSLSVNDYLFVASPETRAFVLSQQVTHILSTRKPNESTEYLLHVLGKRKTPHSYGGVIVHHTRRRVNPKKHKPKMPTRGSAMSLESLAENQRQTQDMLSPKPLSGVNALFKEGFQFTIKKNRKKKKSEPKELGSIADNLLLYVGKGIVGLLLLIFAALRWLMHALWRVIFFSYLLISNRGGQRAVVIDHLTGLVEDKKRAFLRMSLLSKILFALTVISAAVFISSISYIKAKEVAEQKSLAISSSLDTIDAQITDAETRIIYNNEEEALLILQEAQQQLADIQKNDHSDEQAATIEQLTRHIDQLKTSLQKVDTISPTQLVSLGTDVTFTQLSLIDDQLIAFGNDNRLAISIDVDTAQTTPLSHDSVLPLLHGDTPKEEDRIVFVGKQNTIAAYVDDGITVQDISFPTENQSLVDIAVYNRRLYALDIANNQIYRHNPTQTGYDKGRPWIKSAAAITDAVALTIDGSVYVGKADGQVLKFDAGVLDEDFTLSGVDPILSSLTDLWTYTDENSLYVLDSVEKRLLVFSKDGTLQTQYMASEWQDPQAFVVDQKTDTLYLLDRNTIYSFRR